MAHAYKLVPGTTPQMAAGTGTMGENVCILLSLVPLQLDPNLAGTRIYFNQGQAPAELEGPLQGTWGRWDGPTFYGNNQYTRRALQTKAPGGELRTQSVRSNEAAQTINLGR